MERTISAITLSQLVANPKNKTQIKVKKVKKVKSEDGKRKNSTV